MIYNEITRVIRNKEIADNIFEAHLSSDKISKISKPGQFINILPDQNFKYTMRILGDLGAKDKYLNFNLLSPAMLYRMKYKDSKKSGKYLIAFINLIRYFVLRLRIAFIK